MYIREEPGRPQGTAPTMVTNQPPKRNRTIVGAIPCGRPALARGTSFTRLVPCARPGWTGGAYLSGIVPCGRPSWTGGAYLTGIDPCGCPGAGQKGVIA